MTQVVVHSIVMHPATKVALRRFAPDAFIYQGEIGDAKSYSRTVRKHWLGQENLVIIEHDIEIDRDTLPSFESCDAPWCTFSYKLFGDEEIPNALGCTKFSAEIQRIITIPEVDWRTFDIKVAQRLRRAGYQPHVHGSVRHYHDYENISQLDLDNSRQRIALLRAQSKANPGTKNTAPSADVDDKKWHFISINEMDFAVTTSVSEEDGRPFVDRTLEMGGSLASDTVVRPDTQLLTLSFGFVCCAKLENGLMCSQEVRLEGLPTGGTKIEKECDHPPDAGFTMGVVETRSSQYSSTWREG